MNTLWHLNNFELFLVDRVRRCFQFWWGIHLGETCSHSTERCSCSNQWWATTIPKLHVHGRLVLAIGATQSWQSTNHSYFQVACAHSRIFMLPKKEKSNYYILWLHTTYALAFVFTWNSILYPSKSHLKLLVSMWS